MLAAKIDACGAWDVASWAARFSAVLFGQEKASTLGEGKHRKTTIWLFNIAMENHHF